MTSANARAGRREWIALGVLLLPLLLVSMDVSVLYFAIPAISRTLEPSSTQQLWIFDIYGFVLAGLLITMGALGDRIGRRRLLLAGACAFGVASVAAAYAQTAEMLIAARVLLGIGGATLMPSTMALVRAMFHDARQRATAVSVWSATMAGGVALGSVMSGVMLDHFWWGSVFLVNVPAMVMLLALAPLLVPESRDPGPGRFDLLSVPLSMGSVLPVVYGVKRLSVDGLEAAPVAWIAAGLAVGLLFVRRQRTGRAPMIAPALFADRGVGASIALNLLASFAMMGSAYFTTQYLQSVLGKSALEAALWGLVPSVAVGCAAPFSAGLVKRGVNRAHVTAGAFVTAALGFGILTFTGTDSLVTVLTGAGVLSAGIVSVMALVTDMALTSAPPERAGSASALLETGQEFGGALGMAVLGSIGTAAYRTGMADGLPDAVPARAAELARETLGSATVVAGRLPGAAGDLVLRTAREAFTDGMHVAAACAALVLLAAAVLSSVLLRGPGAAPRAGSDAATGKPVPGEELAPRP